MADLQIRRGLGGTSRKLQPKEGILEKQTSNGRRWQKKHFELERGQLHYYEAKGGQKYSDTIKLHEVPIEIDPADPKIIIIRATRVFYFRAESAESASAWYSALKSHSI